MEPAATNTADGYTKSLQIAKFLEWRARLGMGSDNGDEVETRKREALSGSTGHWATTGKGPRALLAAAMVLSKAKADTEIAVRDSFDVEAVKTIENKKMEFGWMLFLFHHLR